MKQNLMKKTFVGFATMFMLLSTVEACTRLVHNNESGYVFTGRTMDWKHDIGTNVWIYPAGMDRESPTENPMKWTSKYGSVFSSGYDISNTDGVNEKGLAINALWLVESQYPTIKPNDETLSLSLWGQYVLDNFASVSEAVEYLGNNPLNLVTTQVPNEERMATIHLALSDSSGDSAIIEYIDGKQVIHHDEKYNVLTNSPTFEEQIVLQKHFDSLGDKAVLMGANNAVDRFARANYYNNKVSKNADPNVALATILSMMKTVSVPIGMKAEDLNLSTTQWTSVIDHNRGRYYLQPSYTQSLFWIDLTKVDFSKETGKVKKLVLGEKQSNLLFGEANDLLIESEPLNFL